MGEAVHAVAVLHEQAEAEPLDWCRGRVAGYKRPQSVRFVADTDMTCTAAGKVPHRLLRDRPVTGWATARLAEHRIPHS